MNSILLNRTLVNSYSAFACWVESSVVACGWIGVPTSVVSEGASGATVSTGAISALPTILLDAKTLLSSVR